MRAVLESRRIPRYSDGDRMHKVSLGCVHVDDLGRKMFGIDGSIGGEELRGGRCQKASESATTSSKVVCTGHFPRAVREPSS